MNECYNMLILIENVMVNIDRILIFLDFVISQKNHFLTKTKLLFFVLFFSSNYHDMFLKAFLNVLIHRDSCVCDNDLATPHSCLHAWLYIFIKYSFTLFSKSTRLFVNVTSSRRRLTAASVTGIYPAERTTNVVS